MPEQTNTSFLRCHTKQKTAQRTVIISFSQILWHAVFTSKVKLKPKSRLYLTVSLLDTSATHLLHTKSSQPNSETASAVNGDENSTSAVATPTSWLCHTQSIISSSAQSPSSMKYWRASSSSTLSMQHESSSSKHRPPTSHFRCIICVWFRLMHILTFFTKTVLACSHTMHSILSAWAELWTAWVLCGCFALASYDRQHILRCRQHVSRIENTTATCDRPLWRCVNLSRLHLRNALFDALHQWSKWSSLFCVE